jgi:hypothetical protein
MRDTFWSHDRSEPGFREFDDQNGIGTDFVIADTKRDGLPGIVTANKRGVFLLEQVRPPRSAGRGWRGRSLRT